ncbi:MAG TPA: hypothetical protein PLP03_00565 [Bacteroidales bacterium]|nr:hypothetical protein [Bacteroidales bacterium]
MKILLKNIVMVIDRYTNINYLNIRTGGSYIHISFRDKMKHNLDVHG